jgi:hypothetical protein
MAIEVASQMHCVLFVKKLKNPSQGGKGASEAELKQHSQTQHM